MFCAMRSAAASSSDCRQTQTDAGLHCGPKPKRRWASGVLSLPAGQAIQTRQNQDRGEKDSCIADHTIAKAEMVRNAKVIRDLRPDEFAI